MSEQHPAANDPQTPEQWQLAVDAAEGVLAVELCRLLGLIDGGGKADADRCADIIKRGAEQGITPSERAVSDFVVEVCAEADHERMLRVVKTAIGMSGTPELAEVVPFLSRSSG